MDYPRAAVFFFLNIFNIDIFFWAPIVVVIEIIRKRLRQNGVSLAD